MSYVDLYYPTKIVPITEEFKTDITPEIFPVLVEIEFDHGWESEIVLLKKLPEPYLEWGPILSEQIQNNNINLDVQEKLYEEILKAVELELEFGDCILKPLTQWYCDKCDKLIENEYDGVLAYKESYNPIWGSKVLQNLSIIHRNKKCMGDVTDFNVFVGLSKEDRLAKLLKLQDDHTIQVPEQFKEIIKRLTLPYYEQGQTYLEKSTNSDIDKYSRYNLRKLILENLSISQSPISNKVAYRIHSCLLNDKLSLRVKGLIIYKLFFNDRPFDVYVLANTFNDTISQVRSGIKEMNQYPESEWFICDRKYLEGDYSYSYLRYSTSYDEIYKVMNDKQLSWAAKAYYLYFVSFDSESLNKNIIKQFCKDRNNNLLNAMNELNKCEYINLNKE